jgi:hypothetical protein
MKSRASDSVCIGVQRAGVTRRQSGRFQYVAVQDRPSALICSSIEPIRIDRGHFTLPPPAPDYKSEPEVYR